MATVLTNPAEGVPDNPEDYGNPMDICQTNGCGDRRYWHNPDENGDEGKGPCTKLICVCPAFTEDGDLYPKAVIK
jgi:hypothetical protein